MVQNIIDQYPRLKNKIKNHLSNFKNKNEDERFNEFMFCLLTPQSNAKKCWEAVELINSTNSKKAKEISLILKGRSRFHNTKAKRIEKSKETWKEVKKILDDDLSTIQKRNSISKIVNGYGLKEASHFLRNIGLSNNELAILDRHILKNLFEAKAIRELKIKGNKHYLELEQQALDFSKKSKIPIDELDVLFWINEHDEMFK